MRQATPQPGQHRIGIRAVLLIDRSVFREPEKIGPGAGGLRIGSESKPAFGESRGQKVIQARLEQRRLALAQPFDVL
jgi:hypothetical protein